MMPIINNKHIALFRAPCYYIDVASDIILTLIATTLSGGIRYEAFITETPLGDRGQKAFRKQYLSSE
jgi:hypothetical protein